MRNPYCLQMLFVNLLHVLFLSVVSFRSGYIKDFEVYDLHRVGRITVQLQGRVNDCRALTYRQDVKAKDIEEYKFRTLPTRQVC